MADIYKNLRASNLGLTTTKEQPLQRLVAPGEVFEAEEEQIPKNWLRSDVGYVRKATSEERAAFEQQRKEVEGKGEAAAAEPAPAPAPAAAERRAAATAPTERAPETPPPAEEPPSRRGR